MQDGDGRFNPVKLADISE